MRIKSKREYIEKARRDYQRGTKRQKGYILDHFTQVTDMTRKHSIRVLSKGYKTPRDRAGRPRIYDQKVLLPHVSELWFDTGEETIQQTPDTLRESHEISVSVRRTKAEAQRKIRDLQSVLA